MGQQNYDEFIDKFKPKLTTDDCYTPPNIYEAVRRYVIETYGVKESDIVRPFYPGGDFERFNYAPNAVVVDNPPFSILAKIIDFYIENEIQFFLFAPTLTLFSQNRQNITYIAVGVKVTYENKANVNTSFVTNLEPPDVLCKSDPELYRRIETENDRNLREIKKQVPKFEYPPSVATSTMLTQMSKHGVDFEVKADECLFVRRLDHQKEHGKAIFGGGYLLGTDATKRKAQAQAQAQAQAPFVWELSDREREMIQRLG